MMKPYAILLCLSFGSLMPASLSGQNPKKDTVRSTSKTKPRPASVRSDTVLVYASGAKIDSLFKVGPPKQPWRLLGGSPELTRYLVVTRAVPGEVEIHELWDDVAIVRSGKGTLRTGYKVKGQRPSGAKPEREWIGGNIEDVKEQQIAPGDFLIIPAKLAHQYIPAAGETLTYWTIKVKRQSNQPRRANPNGRAKPK